MKRSTGIFTLILLFLAYFSASGYKATKESGFKFSRKEITQNNILIEKTFQDSVSNSKAEIEKLDVHSEDIPEQMLQTAYFSYLVLTIKAETTKYEILKIHYLSPADALVFLKISVPDMDLITQNHEFNNFIDKKLNERLGSLFSNDIEKFSDQEINELYSLTFIAISEAVIEYIPKIKDFKSQNIEMKIQKTDGIWSLNDSIYNYTEF